MTYMYMYHHCHFQSTLRLEPPIEFKKDHNYLTRRHKFSQCYLQQFRREALDVREQHGGMLCHQNSQMIEITNHLTIVLEIIFSVDYVYMHALACMYVFMYVCTHVGKYVCMYVHK